MYGYSRPTRIAGRSILSIGVAFSESSSLRFNGTYVRRDDDVTYVRDVYCGRVMRACTSALTDSRINNVRVIRHSGMAISIMCRLCGPKVSADDDEDDGIEEGRAWTTASRLTRREAMKITITRARVRRTETPRALFRLALDDLCRDRDYKKEEKRKKEKKERSRAWPLYPARGRKTRGRVTDACVRGTIKRGANELVRSSLDKYTFASARARRKV